MIIGQIVQSIGRLRYFEIVHAWIYSEPAFLLPMPQVVQNNVDAVIKPFQTWVWVALAAASVTFIGTLLYLKKQMTVKMKPFVQFKESLYMYAIGTLLNQGGYISCKMTSIRLAAGAWCLLAFVLVTVYNGVLISYVTAILDAPPLINSVEDVLAKSDIRLVVDRGQAIDIIFTVLAVKALKEAMKEDYQLTHKCSMIIGADRGRSHVPAGFVLRKRSPYLEMFNRGTLMLQETGLILKWEAEFEADTKPCHSNIKSNHAFGKTSDQQRAPLVRLSLANLAGAFVVLAIGCLISFLAFLTEIVAMHH
ncbi:hypothetical protein DAPPUDRAFT_263197 [Daphnia pulex]|uniref:Ionotropic glutamate receptor C-terminal domain-containing protein n=1 Tax=Daphnia pulex TaxID=6669 RepID=E9HPB3_DAPPU|nr:hypothetical protein DAPPUDRAFT_263197 [Daphnia pulex]|eukprot:EFX66413.1 hypothetical protein DAPPUDRAFT_263197 [Daphnia pulex]